MSVYLSIVAGVLKLLNWATSAIQQHHDEVSGQNKIIAADNAATSKVNGDVAKAAVLTTDDVALDRLRDGTA